jgi:hypothetical protein
MHIMTAQVHQDMKMLRQDLVYFQKIIDLQNLIIKKLLVGENADQLLEEIRDVRKNTRYSN